MSRESASRLGRLPFRRGLRRWQTVRQSGRFRAHLPPVADRRFWAVQGLVLLVAGIHGGVEAVGLLEGLPTVHHYSLSFAPVALFFVPVVYAALNFGLAGSLATALWCTVLTIPNAILFHPGLDRVAELIQIGIVNAIAVFVGQRVDRELSARRRAEAATAALRVYAAHVVSVQEEERRRIAQELHDDTMQKLILICRELDLIEGLDRAVGQSTAGGLRKARRSVEEVVEGLRCFAGGLRPPILDDLGLVVSLRRLLADLAERSRVEGQLELVGRERRLAPDVELALYRIAQEALRNVERHARATRLTVTLRFAEREVGLTVVDDGVGFDLPSGLDLASSGHLGLLGMRERAEALCGRLMIRSRPARGTELSVLMPDDRQAPDALGLSLGPAAGGTPRTRRAPSRL